jgi:hypothetical protein
MEKPKQPFLSMKYVVEPSTTQTILKTKVFIHDEIAEQNKEEFIDRQGWEEEDTENWEFLPWSYAEELFKASEIIELSRGYNPSEISITLERDRHSEYVIASLVHCCPVSQQELESWRKAKEQEELDYKTKYQEYLVQKKLYEIWLIEKEIESKQAKLKQLKKH